MSESIDKARPRSITAQTDASGSFPTGKAAAPSLYVGAGASAGGLKALQVFFDNMDVDSGAAFIVVQHLSPDFVSHMDELLARHTSMSIEVAKHGTEVLANSIYLIPPKTNITLENGALYLTEQIRDGSLNLPIDHFFRSLAENAGHRSVGIIFSGTGSDGSRGIKRIKEAGGLVLVQDRESAEFDGMPVVAAQTGMADLILPPEQLAEHLSTFLKSSMVRTAAEYSLPRIRPDDPDLIKVFDFLSAKYSIDFTKYNPRNLLQRVGRRMDLNRTKLLSDYLQILKRSESEQKAIAHEFLVPISAFFRNAALWEYLVKQVVYPLVKSTDERDGLRFWVPGCATGEEAYSLAIVVDECMRECGRTIPFKIFATDIDRQVLKHAVAGNYGEEIAHDVSMQRLARYFTHIGGHYTVRPEIRATVLFASHNLLTDAPYPGTDFILCRKVIHYFNSSATMAVFSAFHFSLNNHASLIFGESEVVRVNKAHYKQIHRVFQHYTKIPSSSIGQGKQSTLRSALVPGSLASQPQTRPTSQSNSSVQFRHVKDRLIDRYIPACFILDNEQYLIKAYGRAHDFLQPIVTQGNAVSVLDVISEELKAPLRNALLRSRRQSEPVEHLDIIVNNAEQSETVSMIVQLIQSDSKRSDFFAVSLFDGTEHESTQREQISIELVDQRSQRIHQLEHDLAHRQERVEATNHTLNTASNELQLTNEALMSSNEELQSVNEELQSVNEELYTVNNEHQEKIDELLSMRGDLEQVLNATAVCIVILDSELNIRKFTESSKNYFRLIEADIGRQLSDISHSLVYESLMDDIRRTRKTHQSQHLEAQSLEGESVQINILPYRSRSMDDSKYSAVTLTVIPMISTADRESDDKPAYVTQSHPPVSVIPRLRLLVVDDDDVDRRTIKQHLSSIETISIELFEANSVETAIDILVHKDIGLVLIDYRLSHETAHDLASRISEFNEALPLILLSGFAREELEGSVPDALLDYYLNKNALSPLLLELSIRHAIRAGGDALPLLVTPSAIKL